MPPGSLEQLTDLGVLPYLATGLMGDIDDLFAGNSVTPSIVADGITALVAKVKGIVEALRQLVASFEYLGVGSDALTAGECEIDVEVPKDFVDGGLYELGSELHALARIIRPFEELATGSRPPIKVRSISSSHFAFQLLIDPNTAARFLDALTWVLDRYQQVLHLRKMAADLREAGINEAAAMVETEATQTVVGAVAEFTAQMMTGLDDNVRNFELATELRMSVIEIARRIDVGVNFQVRALPPVAESDDPAAEPEVNDGPAYEEIARLVPRVRYMKLDGDSILSLPAPDEASGPDETPDE